MFSFNNIMTMPRSNGAFVGKTYEQLLTRTLPPVIAGWERLGYKQDVHFWIRKFAPAKWHLPKAHRAPLDAKHYIQWYNGSGIYLISQDRAGTSNGLSIDWMAGDEAKLLNKQRLDEELIPTLRGNADKFGHLSNLYSILLATDMPTHPSQRWILDFEEQMDQELINTILDIQRTLKSIYDKRKKVSKKNKKLIAQYEQYLHELRRQAVYFSRASTLDNVHVLGINAIKNLKKVLTDFQFRTSVLNEQINLVEKGFYALLSPERHGYESQNYSYIDTLTERQLTGERDCRWDDDIQAMKHLDIACDYNGAINSIVIGQECLDEYRILNALYVKHPHKLNAAVAKFCRYYKYHKHKTVNYYYDHTAIGGNAISSESFADKWVEELQKQGWKVNRIFIGRAMSHVHRYDFWQEVFEADGQGNIQKFQYNRSNCRYLEESMMRAEIRMKSGHNGEVFEKDKRSERDNNIPAEHATHLSEAADTLIIGTQKYKKKRQRWTTV